MSLADDNDDAGDDREVVRVVDVWICNADAVEAFQLCPMSGIGHMGGITWQGITPGAIRSACLLLRLPRARWPELGRDVAYMGQCVASERNRRAARKK